MNKLMKHTCPICNGSGKIVAPNKMPDNAQAERADIAKRLRERGYSIREIMRLMNYKSPLSITLLLKSPF